MIIYVFNPTKDNSWVIDIAQKISEIVETYEDGDVVFSYRLKYLKRVKIILNENLDILVKRKTGEKIVEASNCNKTFGNLKEKLENIYKIKDIDEESFIKIIQKLELKAKEEIYV